MNTSFSKRRHIIESNIIAEKRFLKEQTSYGSAGQAQDNVDPDQVPSTGKAQTANVTTNPGKTETVKDLEVKFVDGTAKYTGLVFNGVPNGKGSAIYPNGQKYDGEYVNGKKSGRGTIIYSNGDTWDGFWKDDNMAGFGIYTFKDNGKTKRTYIKDGKWVDDVSDKAYATGSQVTFDETYIYVPYQTGDPWRYKYNKTTKTWEAQKNGKTNWIVVDPAKSEKYKAADEGIRARYDKMIEDFLNPKTGAPEDKTQPLPRSQTSKPTSQNTSVVQPQISNDNKQQAGLEFQKRVQDLRRKNPKMSQQQINDLAKEQLGLK